MLIQADIERQIESVRKRSASRGASSSGSTPSEQDPIDGVRSINGETIAIDPGSLTRGYPALLTGLKESLMIGLSR